MRLLPSPGIFITETYLACWRWWYGLGSVSAKEETKILLGETQKRISGLRLPLRDEADCCVRRLRRLFLVVQISCYMDVLLSLQRSRGCKENSHRERLDGLHFQDMGRHPCGHILKLYAVPGYPLQHYFVGIWKLVPPEVPSCFPRGFPAHGNKKNIEDKDMLVHWSTHKKHFNTRDVLQNLDGPELDCLPPAHLPWQAIPPQGFPHPDSSSNSVVRPPP